MYVLYYVYVWLPPVTQIMDMGPAFYLLAHAVR
jgi:hypothetical protein